jgi:hypothetical protein
MLSLLATLFACSLSTNASASESLAPTNWFYADDGEAIDWSSVRIRGGDVTFRTQAPGLRTGRTDGAALLACGAATRATLLFEEGVLVDVFTAPSAPCVEAAARKRDWGALRLEDQPLRDAVHAVVVYDVPAEATCSSCS